MAFKKNTTSGSKRTVKYRSQHVIDHSHDRNDRTTIKIISIKNLTPYNIL